MRLQFVHVEPCKPISLPIHVLVQWSVLPIKLPRRFLENANERQQPTGHEHHGRRAGAPLKCCEK